MSKPKAARAAKTHTTRTQHRDVGEGRAPILDLASAVAIEAANRAVGFDPPPAALAVIQAADPSALQAAREAVTAAQAIEPQPEAGPGETPEDGQQASQE